MTATEPSEHELINRYFATMRRGSDGEDDMMALFTDDVIYDEPFSGIDEPARGRDAVRVRLRRGWEQPPPGLELDVLAIDVTGSSATSRWECRSPAFPAPVRGTDRYEFRDGMIARLEVTIDE